MATIPPTQLPIDYEGQQYSGVYSVSGTLMIARIPGVGSTSAELDDNADFKQVATSLLTAILTDTAAQGRL